VKTASVLISTYNRPQALHRVLEGLSRQALPANEGVVSLMSVCDIVLTTCNVTAHLAGALGKTGGVLVPASKGKIWYWGIQESQSRWYPSLRIFNQISPSSWIEPIEAVKTWVGGFPPITQASGFQHDL